MKKLKVPKKVAGVKVPKALRKQVKETLEQVDGKLARELGLAGLTMAAAAFMWNPR